MTPAQKWLAEVRRRRAAGVCRNCQKKLKDMRAKCPQCRKIEADQVRERRQQKVADGYCSRCNKKRLPDHSMCAMHYISDQEYQKAYAKRKRAAKAG